MGFAGGRELGTGLSLLCPTPPWPFLLIFPWPQNPYQRMHSSGPAWEGMAQIGNGQGPPQSILVPPWNFCCVPISPNQPSGV